MLCRGKTGGVTLILRPGAKGGGEGTDAIFSHRAGKHADILNPGRDAVGDNMGHLEVTVKLSLPDEE